MKKKLLLSALATLATLAGVALLLHNWRMPSLLVLHVGAEWSEIKVRSSNFTGTKVITPGAEPIISGIEHGEYIIGVQYSNGRSLWATYIHTNAGVHRNVALYFQGDPERGIILVRVVANGTQLFEGNASLEQATESTPFPLGGV